MYIFEFNLVILLALTKTDYVQAVHASNGAAPTIPTSGMQGPGQLAGPDAAQHWQSGLQCSCWLESAWPFVATQLARALNWACIARGEHI